MSEKSVIPNTLLFRVFDKSKNCYLPNIEAINYKDKKVCVEGNQWIPLTEDHIIEHCIGDTDDDNKNIFEGDILLLEDANGDGSEEDDFYYSAVGKFGEVDIRADDYDCDTAFFHWYNSFYSVKIVGNIHQNGDLLNAPKN